MGSEMCISARRAVDDRQAPGQFILTGSSVPNDDHTRHSGAGRFSFLRMRPMSLFESGHSSGGVSLAALMAGEFPRCSDVPLTIADIANRLTVGGWPGLQSLSVADAGQAMPNRGRSTTATQALNLFNSRFVAERSEKFAARVQAAHPNNPEQQVAGAFELALCRAPSAVELAAATEVARTHSLAALCRVLFNSNEFLFLP